MLRLQSTVSAAWTNRDESGGALFQPPGYSVFDLFISQRIGDRMTARLALHNLADRTYWAWTDVRGLAPDDPALPYLARPGRTLSLSMQMNW